MDTVTTHLAVCRLLKVTPPSSWEDPDPLQAAAPWKAQAGRGRKAGGWDQGRGSVPYGQPWWPGSSGPTVGIGAVTESHAQPRAEPRAQEGEISTLTLAQGTEPRTRLDPAAAEASHGSRVVSPVAGRAAQPG